MKFISAEKYEKAQLEAKIQKLLEAQEKVTYSKYKIMKFLISKNLWEQFKQWISSMNYQDYWDVPLEFSEDDEDFQKGVDAFKAKFGWSDDQINDMKENCRS